MFRVLLLTCLTPGTIVAAGAVGGVRTTSKRADTTVHAHKAVTRGEVTIEGHTVRYTATAGTIILRNQAGQPTASMFYVAYVKRDVTEKRARPVTFFYNGGPGSSSVWLHMGAFGPRRIETADHTHTPAAPYTLVNNDYSLLDVTDEVFVDEVSTGYSRILTTARGGAGTTRDFYGVDADVAAFGQFIKRYLNQNDRWNSPKYLYGESYGTLRSEVLADYLERDEDIDPNGVILQSAYMGSAAPFMGYPSPTTAYNDLMYETDLPSLAAVAWYHHRLPDAPANLPALLQAVEHFAMHEYAGALAAGNTLDTRRFDAIAQKLHDYTGLSTAYIKKLDLRVRLSEFRHELLNKQGLVVGDLDGRFTGPAMDPASQFAQYDPQGAAISAAYAAGFTAYAHNTLKYGRGQTYRLDAYDLVRPQSLTNWPRVDTISGQTVSWVNGAIDLAQAMKYNPDLKIEVDCAYFDLNLPCYGMVYSIAHLHIPKDLQANIQTKYYRSGHMIYVHVPALRKLHDNTANFIRSTALAR